jgi:arylsulfatase A-like enzyme
MRLRRRDFLALPAALAAQAPRQRPNIVILFADDMSYRTIRALNNSEVRTPNLDKLVSRGTAFTHACIPGGLQGAVCVPSRAMLLSGQNVFHATANVVQQKGYGLAGDFSLMPEYFARLGYETVGIGKWHNGPELYHRCFAKGGPILFGGMADHYMTPLHEYNPAKTYPKSDIKPRKEHSSEIFANSAISFIRNRDKAKPLFLYTAFTAPHDPRQAPPDYKAMYPEDRIEELPNYLPEHPFDNGEMKVRDEALLPWPRTKAAVRKERSDYYAIITHLDAQIGRILDTLDAEGMMRNTVIVFAGDNGLAVGQHGLLGKQNLYDHSIRVPLVVAGPGIPAGKRSDTMVYLYDIFPTLTDLLGTPKAPHVDGISFQAVLADNKKRTRDALVYAYRHVQRGLRTERWKFIRYNAKGVQNRQLFDLQADPWETKNLAEAPEHAETVGQLDILLRMLLKQAGDPLDLSKPDWGWKEPA